MKGVVRLWFASGFAIFLSCPALGGAQPDVEPVDLTQRSALRLAQADQRPAATLRPGLTLGATATVVEFEALATAVHATGGQTVVQPMAGFGPGWGGDAQLFWAAPAPAGDGPRLAVPFSVAQAGSYDLMLFHTLAPDYGRFTVFLDGRPSSDVDGYGPGVALGRSVLGRHELAAGRHRLEVRVTGRNPSSHGHIVGLDRLELTPAGPAPPVGRIPDPLAPPVAATEPGAPPAPVPLLVLGQPPRPRLEARHGTLKCCPFRVEEEFNAKRVQLDWSASELRITFRWQAVGAGIAQGRWEVHEQPPVAYGRRAPPLASGRVDPAAAGAWQSFVLDFGAFRPAPAKQVLPSIFAGAQAAPEDLRPRLYVRVLPVDGAGNPAGQASNTMVVAFDDVTEPGKLKPATGPVPSVSIVRYDPVRPYTKDYLCWLVAPEDSLGFGTDGKPMWVKGQSFYICNSKPSSLLGDVVDALAGAIGSFVDSVGQLVDGVSALYAKVKGGVVDIVAGAFDQIGCGSPCRWAVQMALDAALASVGVPPSVPDFDQLMADLQEQGIDAVTKVVAEAAVSQGLPAPLAEEAARKAITELVEEGKKAVANAAGGGSGQAGSWVPDPARAYRPGRFLVRVSNWSDKPSAEIVLGLYQVDPQKVEVPMIPRGDGSFVDETVEVGGLRFRFPKIPPLRPGTSLLVELPLEPIPDPHRWLDIYHNEPFRTGKLSETFCGKRNVAHYCSGFNDGSPQCEQYHKWQACVQPYGDRQREVLGSAMRLKDAFADVYGPGNDSFRLDLLPKKGGLSIDTSSGVAYVKYPEPTWQGKRVDACFGFTKKCGEPVAQQYCKLMGYDKVVGAQQAQGLPSHATTVTLDTKQACTGPQCVAFSEITCATAAAAG